MAVEPKNSLNFSENRNSSSAISPKKLKMTTEMTVTDSSHLDKKISAVFRHVLKPRYFKFEDCAQLELVSKDFSHLVAAGCYRRYKKLDLSQFAGTCDFVTQKKYKRHQKILDKITWYCTNLEELNGLKNLIHKKELTEHDLNPFLNLTKLKAMDFTDLCIKDFQTFLKFFLHLPKLCSLLNMPKFTGSPVPSLHFINKFIELCKNRAWERIWQNIGENLPTSLLTTEHHVFHTYSNTLNLTDYRLTLFNIQEDVVFIRNLSQFLDRSPNLHTLHLRLRFNNELIQEDSIILWVKSTRKLCKLAELTLNISVKNQEGGYRFIEPVDSSKLIRACHPALKSLDFTGSADGDWLNSLAVHQPQLESFKICLKDCELSLDDWHNLLLMEHLTTLELHGSGNEQCLNVLKDCKSLQTLHFVDLRVQYETARHLFNLNQIHCLSLRRFSIHQAEPDSFFVTMCQKLGGNLENLEIDFDPRKPVALAEDWRCSRCYTPAFLDALADNCPNLRVLSLKEYQQKLSIRRSYSAFSGFTSSVLIEPLCRLAEQCTKLERVDLLRLERIGFSHCERVFLAFFQNCPQLQQLTCYPALFSQAVEPNEYLVLLENLKPYHKKLRIIEFKLNQLDES